MKNIKHLFFALRPKQWIKNFFIFLPLIFGKKLFVYPVNLKVIVAFFLFSITSSVVYLINDIIDAEKDKLHPTKRLRPIASGKLIIREAWIAAAILGAMSIACSFLLDIQCRKVAEEINAMNRNGTESRVVTYGPDIAFYNYQPREGEGVIAAGRTGRDFETFGSAASQTNVKTTIICPQRSVSPSFTKFSDNIRLIADKYEEHMNYRELVDLYANARVIAIPLYEGHSLLGLNSLTDALGMGKPIIMTRNPFIDLDIESLGIGRWVDPGDVPGWKNAIQWFDDHANEAVEMGSRARRLAEERINYATFCSQIADIINKALNNV